MYRKGAFPALYPSPPQEDLSSECHPGMLPKPMSLKDSVARLSNSQAPILELVNRANKKPESFSSTSQFSRGGETLPSKPRALPGDRQIVLGLPSLEKPPCPYKRKKMPLACKSLRR